MGNSLHHLLRAQSWLEGGETIPLWVGITQPYALSHCIFPEGHSWECTQAATGPKSKGSRIAFGVRCQMRTKLLKCAKKLSLHFPEIKRYF